MARLNSVGSTTLGKIAGAASVALLVDAPITWALTHSAAITAVQGGLGVLFAGAFFWTNWTRMNQFASKKSSTYFFTSTAMTVAVVVALVAINYIASKKARTWDLTNKKIYTLAPQTQNALHELKEKVTAIGFLPASDPNYEPLENIFRRYQEEAPDKFEYTFKDPKKNPDLAAKYKLTQGQTTVVLTRGEGDKQTQRSLNVLSEQELTNALISLNAVGEQKVCFVAGHGEWSLEPASEDQAPMSLSSLKRSLSQEGYQAEPVNLAGQADVPKECALLVIAAGKTAYTEPETKVVEKYLDEGGHLAYFAEVKSDLGLDAVLNKYGVQVDNGVVADSKYFNDSPYFVVSLFFGEHEIARQLKQLQLNVIFPGARGLSIVHTGTAEGVEPSVVVTTSPAAWEETVPNQNPMPDPGEKVGQIPLVVASSRKITTAANKRSDEARLVVFGDSELLVNQNWGIEPNRNLVMNAFAWATNQVNKVTIRPPDRDISTIDIDDQMMRTIRFLAMDVAPMALLIVGLGIWISRKNS